MRSATHEKKQRHNSTEGKLRLSYKRQQKPCQINLFHSINIFIRSFSLARARWSEAIPWASTSRRSYQQRRSLHTKNEKSLIFLLGRRPTDDEDYAPMRMLRRIMLPLMLYANFNYPKFSALSLTRLAHTYTLCIAELYEMQFFIRD